MMGVMNTRHTKGQKSTGGFRHFLTRNFLATDAQFERSEQVLADRLLRLDPRRHCRPPQMRRISRPQAHLKAADELSLWRLIS